MSETHVRGLFGVNLGPKPDPTLATWDLDPVKYPHLAEMQRCVAEAQANAVPWRYFRWRRALKAWQQAKTLHRQQMGWKLTGPPGTVAGGDPSDAE